MRFGAQADRGRSLLYGFQGILDLMQPSLRRENCVVRIVGIPELY